MVVDALCDSAPPVVPALARVVFSGSAPQAPGQLVAGRYMRCPASIWTSLSKPWASAWSPT